MNRTISTISACRTVCTFVMLVGTCQFATSAVAEERTESVIYLSQFVKDSGASNHVDYADRLQMLSQQAAAMACFVANDIESDETAQLLAQSQAEFDLLLDALEFGNDQLGIIGEEQDRRTVMHLHDLRSLWVEFKLLTESVVEGTDPHDLLGEIAASSLEVLESAEKLVSEIAGEYSNPTELLQRDAIAIEIAGRQRMLAQRIAKDVCLAYSNIGAESDLEDLRSTAEMFELSLRALQGGMPEAGLEAPPNEEIEQSLGIVAEDWAVVKPIVDLVLSGEKVSDGVLREVVNSSQTITRDMDKVVHMYSEASKLNL